MLVGPREIDDYPGRADRDHLDGLAGRAALGATPHGLPRPPPSELRRGNTVVFSATPVPGNERAVNETIDRLYQSAVTW